MVLGIWRRLEISFGVFQIWISDWSEQISEKCVNIDPLFTQKRRKPDCVYVILFCGWSTCSASSLMEGNMLLYTRTFILMHLPSCACGILPCRFQIKLKISSILT